MGGDHLRLIADFGNGKEAEVTHLRHLGSGQICIHQLLVPFHILAGGHFRLFFIRPAVAGGCQQSLIVIADIGADNHLELPGIGKKAFHHRQCFDGFRVGFSGRICRQGYDLRKMMEVGTFPK